MVLGKKEKMPIEVVELDYNPRGDSAFVLIELIAPDTIQGQINLTFLKQKPVDLLIFKTYLKLFDPTTKWLFRESTINFVRMTSYITKDIKRDKYGNIIEMKTEEICTVGLSKETSDKVNWIYVNDLIQLIASSSSFEKVLEFNKFCNNIVDEKKPKNLFD